jgi:hypothetical protein
MASTEPRYKRFNATTRIEVIDPTQADGQAQLLRLFRRLDLSHVYWEYLLPTARQGRSVTLVAMRNRLWPPWGPEALIVEAVVHICPISDGVACLVGPFVNPESAGNVGMIAAVYKEALEEVERRGKAQIRYIVREDAVLTHVMLTKLGFQRTDALYLSERARYHAYDGVVRAVIDHLGLNSLGTGQLLAYEFQETVTERLALLCGVLDVAWRQLWHGVAKEPELVAFSHLLEDNPPGVQPS